MNYDYPAKVAMLKELIREQEHSLAGLPRKRSWRPSEKAMAAVMYQKRKAIAEQIIEDLYRIQSLEH